MSHNYATNFEFYISSIYSSLHDLVDKNSAEAGKVLVDLYEKKAELTQIVDSLKLQIFHLGMEVQDTEAKLSRTKSRKPKLVEECKVALENIKHVYDEKMAMLHEFEIKLKQLCKEEKVKVSAVNQDPWRQAELLLLGGSEKVD